MNRTHLFIATAAMSLSLGACSCGDDGTFSREGPGIEVSPEALAFGDVPLGAIAELALAIKNTGQEPLHICVEGTDLPASCDQVSEIQPTVGPFRVRFENLEEEDGSWAVAESQTRDLMVVFQPQMPESFTGKLILIHDAPGGSTEVMLSGAGVEPELQVSTDRLDFGEVTAGMRKTLDLTLTNPTPFRQPITIPPLAQDSVIFGTANEAGTDTAAGDTYMGEVPGRGSLMVRVWFQPLDSVSYENTLTVSYCPSCSRTVALTGVGIKPVFELVPPALDFGESPEAVPVMRTFSVLNTGTSNLTVNAIGVENGTTPEFTVAPRMVLPAVVAPMAQLDVDVTYFGETPGTDTGRVQVDTNAWDDPATAVSDSTKYVALTAISRGPDIDVLPPLINFGTVGIGGTTTRNLIIQNAGNAALDLNTLTFNSPSPEITVAMQPAVPRTIDPADSVTIVLAYTPVDAGVDEATITVTSNDRDEGTLTIRIQGLGGVPTTCSVNVAPTQVTFGLVQRGRDATLPVEIRNAGAQPCTISNIRMTGGAEFTFASAPPASMNVGPGTSLRVDVKYSPADYGSHSTLLEFASDDPAQMNVQVPVNGSCAPSDLEVIPSELDFSVVPVLCSSPTRIVSLYNIGSNNITVTQVYLDPLTSPEFELQPFATPVTIAPGAFREVQLTYSPQDIGIDTGVLFVSHSNAQVPVAVPLSGEGALNPTVTDTFNQSPTPQADVLFVVDNSGSMSEEQSLLGSNIGSFVSFAQQAGIDYQIAVTTTDVEPFFGGAQGRMVGSPIFITPSTANGNTVFSNRINGLGTGGSGTEQGLEAAYLALSDPLINTDNLGFLRADAALAVIVVSDEEDYSPQQVSFYESFFRNIKGFANASLFSFSAVAGITPGGCTSSNGAADYGSRYVGVAQATGGVVESICNSNWGTSLANIGLNSFGLRRSFALSSAPVPVTIAVTVDGATVPSITPGGQQNWSYDAATNSIIFTAAATPDANSVITVTYSVLCGS